MKTTVIHHSADWDGLFCREIARKFLPEAELIGWDFADPPVWPTEGITVKPHEGVIYVLDLPIDKVLGFSFSERIPQYDWMDFVWIDHHASSIASHPTGIPGYRIDGVAACRLAWQWFSAQSDPTFHRYGGALPTKDRFVGRFVSEPIAVRLAGEYDIWDKRDPNAELFQHGLRTRDMNSARWGDHSYWEVMLSETMEAKALVNDLLVSAKYVEYAQKKQDEFIAKNRSFDVEFEGLKFMTINAVRCNSLTFEAATRPDHDALMGFYWNGKDWNVSMYHAPHRKDLDLSAIAVKYGGGGHKGACGFRTAKLPFVQ